jgi:hypothetical protein
MLANDGNVVRLSVWKRLTLTNIRTALGLALGAAVGINEFFIEPEPRYLGVAFSFALVTGTVALLGGPKDPK